MIFSDLNGHAHFGSSTQSQPLYDLYQPNGAPPGTLSISQNNLNDGPNPLNDPYYQHQYNSQQRRPNGGLQLGVGTGKFGTLQTPIPLNEFPSHVEHLKQNNNELFIKVCLTDFFKFERFLIKKTSFQILELGFLEVTKSPINILQFFQN